MKDVKIGYIQKKEIDNGNLKISGTNYFELNPIVKSSLLVTLAGYLEKDKITVFGKKYYDSKKLSRFFSYILNDKRVAPKIFKISIKFTNELEKLTSLPKNNYDYIVSFSGGIDSTAGILYALDKGFDIKPVWIGFGQKNEDKELRVIKKICNQLKLKPLIIRVDLRKYVDKGWSRWKMGIIPARNFLFASIASSIASKSTKKNVSIYLCAHKEEVTSINTDKSMRFFRTCTKIFKEFYDKNILLTSPFLKITKPEILSFWISNTWGEKYKISPLDTVSCYYGNKCGMCKACINRAIAFYCAGVKIENFRTNPFMDKGKLIRKAYVDRFDTLRKERKLDFLYAMNAQRKNLPVYLRNFLDMNYVNYKKLIDKRIAKISNIEKI